MNCENLNCQNELFDYLLIVDFSRKYFVHWDFFFHFLKHIFDHYNIFLRNIFENFTIIIKWLI